MSRLISVRPFVLSLMLMCFLALFSSIASAATTVSSGQAVAGSVAQGSWQHYAITSGSGANNVVVDLTGLSADVDLYVKKGVTPTTSSYDCRPYKGGTTSESCSVALNTSTTIYISVYGYRAGSFKLKATLSGSPPPSTTNTLTSGQAVYGSVTQSNWAYYSVSSGSTASNLIVEMTGLSADVDLYVKKGATPTASSYNCRPYNAGTSSESCSIALASSSTVYIGVYGYRTGSFTIKATLSTTPTTDDHSNTTVNATPLTLNSAGTVGGLYANDIDFFQVYVGSAGILTAESEGSTNTYGRIYNSSGTQLNYADGGGSGQNFKVSYNVPNAGTYYISVKGASSSVTGSYGVKAYFALPKPTLKDPINNKTVSQTDNTTFSWNAVPAASKYRLVISPYSDFRDFTESAGDNGCENSTCLTIPNPRVTSLTGNSYIKSGFQQAGTTYYWKVRAANSYGSSIWSDVWSIKTSGAANFPSVDWRLSAYRNSNIFWTSGNAPKRFYTDPSQSQLGNAKGNCTWYAHGRLKQLGYNSSQLNKMTGHAFKWASQATASGITVSHTPIAGSIAQSTANRAGYNKYGHVAVVEKVNSDGTVLISESSYAPGSANWDFEYRTRTVSATHFNNYIHVKKP